MNTEVKNTATKRILLTKHLFASILGVSVQSRAYAIVGDELPKGPSKSQHLAFMVGIFSEEKVLFLK